MKDDRQFYNEMYGIVWHMYSETLDMNKKLIYMINEYEEKIESLKLEIEALKNGEI